jgi:predicted porin
MDTGASGRFGGDNLFSRDANVALAGPFGRVMVGRASAPNFIPSVISNPFASSFAFSPLIVQSNVPSGPFGARTWIASNAGDTGWSNQVVYSTPEYNGLKVNLHFQAGEVSNDSSKRNVGVNAFYVQGPLTLTAFYHDVQVANPNPGVLIDATAAPVRYNTISRQKTAFVGGNYVFRVATAYASYQSSSNDTSTALAMEDKLFSAGLRVPAGGGAILLAHAGTRRSGTLVGADLERDTTSIGYDYFISKRTDVYAVIMNDKITAASRASSYGVGVRHTF